MTELRNVVFPAPFAPRSVTISPGWTWRSTFQRTLLEPYRAPRSAADNSAPGTLAPPGAGELPPCGTCSVIFDPGRARAVQSSGPQTTDFGAIEEEAHQRVQA